MSIPRADEKVVKELFDRLIACFEKFASEKAERSEEGLRYIDGLMACHNFYKAVIFDLERRSGDDANFYRKTAIETLALALGIPVEVRRL